MSAGLILGLDGPEVRVTARVASRLARPLAEAVRRARLNGERLDQELINTVAAIETAARAWAAHQVTEAAHAANGTSARAADDEPSMIAGMNSTAVAGVLGCRPRNVRALAERGTLPGTKLGRHWSFDPADVAALARTRSESV